MNAAEWLSLHDMASSTAAAVQGDIARKAGPGRVPTANMRKQVDTLHGDLNKLTSALFAMERRPMDYKMCV
jgi:hypothetical protein